MHRCTDAEEAREDRQTFLEDRGSELMDLELPQIRHQAEVSIPECRGEKDFQDHRGRVG